MNSFDIYSQIVMEHGLNSPNKRDLPHSTAKQMGHNPNCGDEIEVQIEEANGVLKDLSFVGHGCAISQSSTSLMIDAVRGKKIEEAKKIVEIFLKLIKREDVSEREKQLLKDAVFLENVANMPARVKCAVLSWHTLEQILSEKKN